MKAVVIKVGHPFIDQVCKNRYECTSLKHVKQSKKRKSNNSILYESTVDGICLVSRKIIRGWLCDIRGKATTCSSDSPAGCWFTPCLLHFLSSSILIAWEKAKKDGQSIWAPKSTWETWMVLPHHGLHPSSTLIIVAV